MGAQPGRPGHRCRLTTRRHDCAACAALRDPANGCRPTARLVIDVTALHAALADRDADDRPPDGPGRSD